VSEGSHKKRKGLWFEKWISVVIFLKEKVNMAHILLQSPFAGSSEEG
jgi:hypothetical protein